MSHPFMPQPYYFVRQSRTTAPWPAPMGAYTAGIFDDDYLNIPDYVHEDRIAGFAGDGWYEGYGQDAPGCLPAGEAAAKLYDVVVAISANVRIPEKVTVKGMEISLPVIGGRVVGDMLNTDKAQSVLQPLLAKGVIELANVMKSAGDVQAAFTRWLENMFYMTATAVIGEWVADKANDVGLWGLLAGEARKFLVGEMLQLPFQNICTETVYTEAPAIAAPTLTATQIRRAYATQTATGRLVQAQQYGPQAPMRVAAPVPQPVFFAPSVVGVAQPGAAAPRAAGGTVALLGAAALALLLLRR